MEHTYQPEEAIIGANYDTYRNYFTSPPPLSPLRGLNNGKFPGLTPEAEWDGQAAGPQINVSQWMSSGNTVVDGYFYMSWNIARWISQQPQCLGPLANLVFSVLLLITYTIQRIVFGNLRSSEHESLKDQFWTLVFYKVVFVFGVANVQNAEEAVSWCAFVSVIGLLQIARQLCQERHNYLIMMNDWSRKGQCRRHRILGLLLFIFGASVAFFAGVTGWFLIFSPMKMEMFDPFDVRRAYKSPVDDPSNSAAMKSSTNTAQTRDLNLSLHSTVFILCELGLLLFQTMHVLVVCVLEHVRTKWARGRQLSEDTYSNLINNINFRFEMISLLFDLVHHLHMLICCNLFLSMTSLIVSLQMRNRVRQMHRVLKKRQSYLWLTEHINHYSDAPTGAEDDNCAICWESLFNQSAKSLPCHHIFHKLCLRQWLMISMNCPTCRLSLVNEKEPQFRPVERTSRRLYAPRPVGFWGFLQTGQALLDLFGGWDPQYAEEYDEDPPVAAMS